MGGQGRVGEGEGEEWRIKERRGHEVLDCIKKTPCLPHQV